MAQFLSFVRHGVSQQTSTAPPSQINLPPFLAATYPGSATGFAQFPISRLTHILQAHFLGVPIPYPTPPPPLPPPDYSETPEDMEAEERAAAADRAARLSPAECDARRAARAQQRRDRIDERHRRAAAAQLVSAQQAFTNARAAEQRRLRGCRLTLTQVVEGYTTQEAVPTALAEADDAAKMDTVNAIHNDKSQEQVPYPFFPSGRAVFFSPSCTSSCSSPSSSSAPTSYTPQECFFLMLHTAHRFNMRSATQRRHALFNQMKPIFTGIEETSLALEQLDIMPLPSGDNIVLMFDTE